MAHVPAFLYLFCTHVPAHAVLLAPEAAALHVPRSASHAYSKQVGLQAASVLTKMEKAFIVIFSAQAPVAVAGTMSANIIWSCGACRTG